MIRAHPAMGRWGAIARPEANGGCPGCASRKGRSMRPRTGATSALAIGAAAATALALLATPAAAQSATRPSTKSATHSGTSDVREVPPGATYRLSKDLAAAQAAKSAQATASSGRSSASAAVAAGPTPPVGTQRQWLGLDDFNGFLYRKTYTLRGVGDNIEVWVASGTDATSTGTQFPAGDCRNATPGSTDITDAQVAGLVQRVRRQHPAEGVGGVQCRARPRRHATRRSRATSPATATRWSRSSTTSATTTSTTSRQHRRTSPGSSRRRSTSCSTATS